ncbi:MAG: MFS transporter [Spirochaetota bacterium]
MSREEKTIVFFSAASHFFAHFYILLFPPLVMPLSRELGLPLAKVVDLSFSMYLLYGLVAIPWGILSDRVGHKWAMSLGVIIAGLGMFLAGAASYTGASLFLFSGALALVGIGCSSYHPSGMALVSQGVTQRGRALGIVGIAGNSGIATVPFTVGILNYFLGWQNGLMLLGGQGIALGMGIMVAPLSVEKGKDKIRINQLKKEHAGKLFFIFLIGILFGGLMFRSFTVILPAYLEHELGSIIEVFREFAAGRYSSLEDIPAFNTLTANLVATAVYVVGIFGQFVGGRVADRFSLKWAYFLYFCIAAPFLAGIALFPSVWIIVFSGIFVFFMLGMQPIENSLIAFLTPPHWRSVSYGIKFMVGFGAGAFAIKLISAVESAYGIRSVIWLIGLFLLLMILSLGFFMLAGRGMKIDQKEQ